MMFGVSLNHAKSKSYFGLSNVHLRAILGQSCLDLFDLGLQVTFYQRLQGSLCATGDPMTQDRHYTDHLSHYVSPGEGARGL